MGLSYYNRIYLRRKNNLTTQLIQGSPKLPAPTAARDLGVCTWFLELASKRASALQGKMVLPIKPLGLQVHGAGSRLLCSGQHHIES